MEPPYMWKKSFGSSWSRAAMLALERAEASITGGGRETEVTLSATIGRKS